MSPDEMFQAGIGGPPPKPMTEEAWKQAAGELRGLALSLRRRHGQITAAQIEEAVRRGNAYAALAEILKKLDAIDCTHGYSIPDEGMVIFWEVQGEARALLKELGLTPDGSRPA